MNDADGGVMLRREVVTGIAAGAAGWGAAAASVPDVPTTRSRNDPYVLTNDGTRLFVKDWGRGEPLLFVASAAVGNDIWQYQHAHFLTSGHRVVAFDRRGHGRSSQPGDGYDTDTLADDLACVIESLGLHDVTLIGHSMGCGEIVRYLHRHGGRRVRRIALVSTMTPCLLRRRDNPQGIDRGMFEAVRAEWRQDFPGWVAAHARPFFVPETSQAMIDWGIAQMRSTPPWVAVACNQGMAESDFRRELQGLALPALVVHGTADVSAPIALTGAPTAALLRDCRYLVYEGAPHGLMLTHMQRLNTDLAAFIAGRESWPGAA
jgi:pimeloyl-ACP methyl ester carboxylesterase